MAESPHPVARILLGCGWAVAVETLAPPLLTLLAVAVATAFLFAPIRQRFLYLLRRTRWLLAILFVTYALTASGALLWPMFGWASPTLEGLQTGALRVVRLLLMLGGLAVLLATTERARLIYGIYALAWPLSWLGLDRRALAVRLGLTLGYVERSAPATRWLDALLKPPADESMPTVFILQTERWQTRDSAVILAALILAGIALV